jgi:hypothetical protein
VDESPHNTSINSPSSPDASTDATDDKTNGSSSWLDEPSQEIDDVEVGEYEIVSSPNDWNFATIVNFVDSGALKIPAFQRNYVWDRKRASKLIESLLIGLPVPQVFLYEEGRNSFLVIDGQQRLLTLFFYAHGRFPRPNARSKLREIINSGPLDDATLADDAIFEPFRLSLPKSPGGHPNRFHGLTYLALKDDKTSLDLRTIRNTVVKQTSPDGSSAVFEIFSRLNTGGVNLSPQEIRASLYHSGLFTEVLRLNEDLVWRRLLGKPTPDTRMRDTEFLLRGLALARGLDKLRGSLSGFINKFCLEAKSFEASQQSQAIEHLNSFIYLFAEQPADVFMRGNKFSGVLFETFFAAWIRLERPVVEEHRLVEAIATVKQSEEFAETLQEGSTKSVNVQGRVELAETALRGLM